MTKTVLFVIDAQAILSAEEKANVQKYGLGKDVLYTSEAAKDHLASAQGGGWRGAVALARAAMSLRITVDSLTQGQHIECKNLDEALAAEEALVSSCNNLVQYIRVASLFNGEFGNPRHTGRSRLTVAGNSAGDDLAGGVISLSILALLILLAFFFVWIALGLGVLFLIYAVFRFYQNSDAVKERKAREHIHALYDQAAAVQSAAPSTRDFLRKIEHNLPSSLPDRVLKTALETAKDLYEAEGFGKIQAHVTTTLPTKTTHAFIWNTKTLLQPAAGRAILHIRRHHSTFPCPTKMMTPLRSSPSRSTSPSLGTPLSGLSYRFTDARTGTEIFS